MRVKFSRTFRFYPLWPSKVTYTEYEAGKSYTVKRAAGEEAVAQGAGREIKAPPRKVAAGAKAADA
jgi:hypothetical protein